MSSTYAGASSFPTNITIPDDGDPRTAASVNVAFEGLADRTVWAKRQSVTRVADVAALKALTPTNGDLATILKVGLFQYVDPSGFSEDLPWVVEPTSGTGVWFHVLYSVRDIANGLAGLDGGGKVPLVHSHNAIITTSFAALDENVSTLAFAATATDVPAAVLTIADPKENDILEFYIVGKIDNRRTTSRPPPGADPDPQIYVRAVVGFAGANFPPGPDPWAEFYVPMKVPFAIRGEYTCTALDEANGSVSVKLQGSAEYYGAGPDGYILGSAIRASLVRP